MLNGKIAICLTLLASALLASPANASDFPRHQSAEKWLYDYSPQMSFDSNSCLPIAAVDAQGNINGGLNASGSPGGDCRSLNLTQGYNQNICKTLNGAEYCVLVYGYYFEKDQAKDVVAAGHRHDWEFVIMWLKNKRPEYMTISNHASWRQYDLFKNGVNDTWNSNLRHIGKRYKVRYYRTQSIFSTNSLDAVTTGDQNFGGTFVNYTRFSQLNTKQKNTLNNGDFGSANFKMGSRLNGLLNDQKPSEFPYIW